MKREAGLAPESVFVVEDGGTVDLGPDGAARGEDVPTGFVFVDGMGIGDVEEVVLRDRRHLAEDGIVVITMAVERHTGKLRSGPEITSRGFIEPELSTDLLGEAARRVAAAVEGVSGSNPETTQLVQEAARTAALRFLYRRTRRRPMVLPVVTEV